MNIKNDSFNGASPLYCCNPIPFIPFPFVKGKGKNRKRGAAPFKHPKSRVKERQILNKMGEFERASALSRKTLPPLL